MTRKCLFIAAAMIITFEMSVIFLMLSPLHTRSAYNMFSRFSYPQLTKIEWCKGLRFREPPSRDVVALVSFPGSGNTWLRYLLQQATGIMTGSVYNDLGLRLRGFPAENVTTGSVLVVKTHEMPTKHPNMFKSAVLLIRNPRDAILAEYNRMHKGHTGTLPRSAFKNGAHGTNTKLDWAGGFASLSITHWERFHEAWLRSFRGSVCVVQYRRLVRDTRRQVQRILRFLNYTVPEEDLSCALGNREGFYRRRKKHKNFDPYTHEMYTSLSEVINRVASIIAEHQLDIGEPIENVTLELLSETKEY